jgi:small-conductance mechanosensitive channel
MFVWLVLLAVTIVQLIRSVSGVLEVYIVPHSHCDPG